MATIISRENMKNFLEKLSKERPIFHSEADFQHALAWRIHKERPKLNIRLEKKEILDNQNIYFDIFIFNDNGTVTIIEVKYKTAYFNGEVNGEEFNLTDQGAQDLGRYDFIKDISRIEKALKKYNGNGFAIFLTNDPSYWKEPCNENTADRDFRIHEGRSISGELRWQGEVSEATVRGREEPITLEGEYILNWKDYSILEGENGTFRYLLVEVNRWR